MIAPERNEAVKTARVRKRQGNWRNSSGFSTSHMGVDLEWLMNNAPRVIRTRIMINDLWFTNFLEKINNRTRIGTIQYKKPRAKDIVSAGPKMDDP